MRNPLAKFWPWRTDDKVLSGGDLDVVKSAYEGEHTMDLEELKEKLQTNTVEGLTSSEAVARLARDGPNSQPTQEDAGMDQVLQDHVQWFRRAFVGRCHALLHCFPNRP